MLQSLPRSFTGIVVAQHIPPVFSRIFAERLHETTAFTVKEAVTGDPVLPGQVLVAPGDSQMRVVRLRGGLAVECWNGLKVNGHSPSIDVLFESVAAVAGQPLACC